MTLLVTCDALRSFLDFDRPLCSGEGDLLPHGTAAWVEGEAKRKLEATALETLDGEVPYSTMTRVGDPIAEILRAEKELGSDLVVMATHGRKGVWRVALGSVVEKVVRSSTCPVLTTAPEAGS